ncbi:TnsD family Tn7-like transposition protein [Ralstonia pickettii]|uniref:TnsD family Tn7-like transposition protein n=1 Tax=Ralstonia pickettii TaxID=329 RepID=UPI0015862001|nr:TnsD family Tn7-like transposition protein [Ralstonia pickettii]
MIRSKSSIGVPARYSGDSSIRSLLEDDSDKNTLWNGNLHLLEVAHRSVDLLACGKTEELSATSEHYLSLAQVAGLTKPSGIVDVDLLSREMRAMYGEDFLNSMGLSSSAERPLIWPKDMMTRPRASFQPIQHILLSNMLNFYTGKIKNGGQPHLTARQKFTCPNRYAVHGSGHIIERVMVEQVVEGRIGRGHCSCGLKFSFWRCSEGTNEPEIAKVFDYGKDWRDAVHAMRRDKKPFATIARETGVSVGVIKGMVRGKCVSDAATPDDDIIKSRSEWELLLESVAPLGHDAARKLNEGLYLWLSRHDADWFRGSGRRCRKRPSGRPRADRVDWGARDKVWSEAFRTAAAKLYSSASRSTRVSQAAIISEAAVEFFGHQLLYRLPLCRAALTELAESLEQFAIFRLRRAARNFHDQGESIVRWKLMSRVYVGKNRMTPLIRTTIDQLMDEFSVQSLQGYQEDQSN